MHKKQASSPLATMDQQHGFPNQSVDQFQTLVAILQSSPFFSDYVCDHPHPDLVSLTKDETHLIFINHALWSTDEAFLPYANVGGQKNAALICCGTETHFESVPPSVEISHSHVMVFPLTLAGLRHQIHTLHRHRRIREQVRADLENAQNTNANVKQVLSISRQLNGVRNVNKLLDLILQKAREVTGADAGSIYVVEQAIQGQREGSIIFKITHNESVEQSLSEFRLPISDQSIVGNAVIHARSINIPDLYLLKDDPATNPYGFKHDTSWERRIGYECHSMLTLPMFDISHSVIGVIQLINRKSEKIPLRTPEDFKTKIIPFGDRDIEYGEIVAHQAGIALENAVLTDEKEALFEGFVDASVRAIEQRDPTTSGHSHRVAHLTLRTAELISRLQTGVFSKVRFNEAQMKEIEYASLLHDFGKLAVREQVLLKAKKLYPWQMELIMERFELVRTRYENEYLREMLNFLQAPNLFPPGIGPQSFMRDRDNKLTRLGEFLQFILKANEPTVLEQGGFERLRDIANCTFADSRRSSRPFLTADELKSLSVSRGSLTGEEFAEIQSHVTHTYEFLRTIPWGKDLANVPQIAAKHHEKLDGSGYPTSAHAEEIPLQSRIMTVADIFDALTAADRPYKKAVPYARALEILEMEVKAGKCDGQVLQVFIESKVYQEVLQEFNKAAT